jgi:hypothetical protein
MKYQFGKYSLTKGGYPVCYRKNGNRHFGSLHILYQLEPSETDRHFVQVRQWLTAEGEYSDLVVEHGQVENNELQTEMEVVPFHFTAEQALDLINGRKAE